MTIYSCEFKWHDATRQIKIDLDEQNSNEKTVADHLKVGQFYEPDIANVMLRCLTDGDVVVDVGANVGFFTILASELVGASGRVIAFEPGQENLQRLSKNLELNESHNVTIIEK